MNFRSLFSRVVWRERWRRPAGYRELLLIAVPLVLSTGSMTVQQFTDRMFLSWYSPEALAASMPAGITSFALLCFFLGTVSYVNTFVAQYHGAGRKSQVANSVWQGIYLSLFAGVAVLVFVPLAEPLFRMVGHDQKVQALEVTYFRIMMFGGGFAILSSALSAFFTGLGRTIVVMYVNIGTALLNIVLDYVLIFGHFGLPEMGIAGAAIATIIASACGTVLFFLLFLSRANRREFNTGGSRAWNHALFLRLMRYGAPNGFHFMLDLFAFSLFILLVGRIGVLELAATNLAFQVNNIIFMPMLGFSIATTTLVGRSLGENRPDRARRVTWYAFHLTFSYMAVVAALYILIPDVFIKPFGVRADPVEFAPVRDMAVILLIFVALYSLFDAFNLIFAAALKGAGDTVFVMIVSAVLGITLMVLPTWWVCRPDGPGIYVAWAFLTLFVIVLGVVFFIRFLQGRWQSMRVIEQPSEIPPVPTVAESVAEG